jgi:carbamoyl-phosphate synthase large subunit
MMSEYLGGREVAVQLLFSSGGLVACQCRQRVEYLMGSLFPSGQSSSPSVAKTISDGEATQLAEDAVAAIDDRPHGVYGVDMKEGQDGNLRVTEINLGRFYTTSDFMAVAGLNLPGLFVAVGFGLPAPEQPLRNPLPDGLLWLRQVDALPKLVTSHV